MLSVLQRKKPSLELFACPGNVFDIFCLFFLLAEVNFSVYEIDICLFHSMEITGMLYILPRIVLQVEAYLYYETINKTILSFWDVFVTQCDVFNNLVFAHLASLSCLILSCVSGWRFSFTVN